MASSAPRTVATSAAGSWSPSVGTTVRYPSLASAAVTRSHPPGPAHAPCTRTIVGRDAPRAGDGLARAPAMRRRSVTLTNATRRRAGTGLDEWRGAAIRADIGELLGTRQA